MKKLNILLMGTVAFCLASCEDTSDLGIAQVNPELPSFSADGLTVSGVPSSVNLDATVNQSIPVITVGSMENLPEGATVNFAMQLSNDENFSNPVSLDVVDGSVSSDEWEDYVLSTFGKSPENVTNYIRFAAYVLDNGQLSRLGGEDKWYLPTTVAVTPVDLRLDVEKEYYLSTGAGNIALSHTDKHPYDDPNFSLIFEVASDQLPYEWMIAPESAVDGGSSADFYGVPANGSADALSGELVLGGKKGVINAAGNYKLEVNMLDKTYSLTKNSAPDVEFLYTPGGANGWSWDNNMLLKNNDDNTFSGYVYIDGEFKLTAQANWDLNWGLNAGTLTAGGSTFNVDSNGLYYVVANFNDMTAGLTEITSIGVVGSMNGWNQVDNIELTPNEALTIWTGEVTFEANSEWKFNMNKGWGINLGGAIDNLVQDGGNLTVAEEGTYTVTLDLSKLPYSCTVVKK